MEYEIRIAAIFKDIVPLSSVAHAMAMQVATAGGTPFHKPAYDVRFRDVIRNLLHDARVERLVVCSQSGRLGTIEELTQEAIDSGRSMEVLKNKHKPDWVRLKRDHPQAKKKTNKGDLFEEWDFAGARVDLGPLEVDTDATTIQNLYAKLKSLNDWGAPGGDSFTISSDGVGWLDERKKWIEPTAAVKTAIKDTAPASTAVVELATVGSDTAPPERVDPAFSMSPAKPVLTTAVNIAAVTQEPNASSTTPRFHMTRAAMIDVHRHEWPSIGEDLTAAASNGLAKAKAGPRGWIEEICMDWARSKGKLQKSDPPIQSLTKAAARMIDLPGQKHTLQG